MWWFATPFLIAVAGGAGCSGRAQAPGPTVNGEASPAPPSATEDTPLAAPSEIVLLFPSPDDDLLHAERRTVVTIRSPEDRAIQVLEELFRGPSPGLLAAVPDGVRVRQVFLLPDGTAYIDLSTDVTRLGGGSRAELQTVYAIVDTLTLNVPEIARVGILVEGDPRETLAGHVHIGNPIEPDYGQVEESVRPAVPTQAEEIAA
jgi:spore germination protein GerM